MANLIEFFMAKDVEFLVDFALEITTAVCFRCRPFANFLSPFLFHCYKNTPKLQLICLDSHNSYMLYK